MARRIQNRRIERESFDASTLDNRLSQIDGSIQNIENEIINISGTSFLDISEFDDTDATYYFYGGLDNASDWKINRYLKTTLVARESADEAGNPTKTSLAAAWTDRLTLTYV